MSLFDDYVDLDQFQASGGLLGRLLSLPQMQGLQLPGANLDQAPSAPLMPPLKPIPSAILQSHGQPPSDSQAAAPDLHSQYQALRPILGDRNAMVATVNPDAGKTLIAQALADQQSGDTGNVVSVGYRGGIPIPIGPVPPPPIPMPAIPDWWKAAGPILRRVFSGVAGGGNGDYRECMRAADGSTEQWEDFCRSLGLGQNNVVGGETQKRACWAKALESPIEKKHWCENQFNGE